MQAILSGQTPESICSPPSLSMPTDISLVQASIVTWLKYLHNSLLGLSVYSFPSYEAIPLRAVGHPYKT